MGYSVGNAFTASDINRNNLLVCVGDITSAARPSHSRQFYVTKSYGQQMIKVGMYFYSSTSSSSLTAKVDRLEGSNWVTVVNVNRGNFSTNGQIKNWNSSGPGFYRYSISASNQNITSSILVDIAKTDCKIGETLKIGTQYNYNPNYTTTKQLTSKLFEGNTQTGKHDDLYYLFTKP